MKKVLALVLVACMLLSCMIVGISAVREVTSTTEKRTYWQFHEGNSYAPINVGTQDSSFDIEMDIRLDAADACFGDGFASLATSPKFSATGVGVSDQIISGTYNANQWYHVKWDNNGDGTTTIYVDGANVGTVNAVATLYEGNQMFYQWLYLSIDNLVCGTYSNDMESGLGDYQGQGLTDETTVINNDNVSYGKNAYWQFHEGNSYAPINVGTQDANFDIEMDIRLDSASADAGFGTGFASLATTPRFSATGIGVGDQLISATYNEGQWYHVKWDNLGDGTTDVYVDGAKVGNVSAVATLYEGNQMFYQWLYLSIDNLVCGTYSNDMEGGLGDYQGQGLTEDVVIAKRDLGKKFWQFHEGNSYAPINVGTQDANFDIEMDICLDTDAAEFGLGFASLATTPRITTSAIGVGETTVAYNFTVGQWYHVKWDNLGDGTTDVYVDDAKVGNVSGVATLYEGNQLFYQWLYLSIDNLSAGTYFNDMEDTLGDYQGQGLEYDLTIEGSSIFDKFDNTAAAGGDALLIENSWDATAGGYVELGSQFASVGTSWLVDFDMAILPTHDSADGNYFEIWTNWSGGSTPKRWKVGTTFVGKDEDLIQYAWGDATKDNFHSVTIEFKSGKGYIYVDNELLYEGAAGTYNEDLTTMLAMNWNANVIIDNFQYIDTSDWSVVASQDNLPTGSGWNRGNNVMKIVNLDAEDYCAENGCMTGKTTMEYDSTCYSVGNNQTWCAVCGELKDNHEIALKYHNWTGYDITRKTDAGLVYVFCKNEGCTEMRYTELPKNYEGTLYQFFDMSDDMVLVFGDTTPSDASGLDGYNADGEQCWQVTEDGRLEFLGHAVYDEFWGIESAKMPVNDWSISFDLMVDSTKHWTNEDGGVDSECFFIRCCGNAGYQLSAGWDRNTKELFIRKTDGSAVLATLAYEFEDGVEYNFKVSCKYEGYGYTHEDSSLEAPWYAEIAIWINGEKVLAYGDTDGTDQYSIYDIAYGTDHGSYQKFPAFAQFGTSYTMDNLAFGSYDFEIVKLAGDIDGDGELSASDATMMRQYLAGRITLDDFVDAEVADVNGDGVVNAKDQLAIRIALAA